MAIIDSIITLLLLEALGSTVSWAGDGDPHTLRAYSEQQGEGRKERNTYYEEAEEDNCSFGHPSLAITVYCSSLIPLSSPANDGYKT